MGRRSGSSTRGTAAVAWCGQGEARRSGGPAVPQGVCGAWMEASSREGGRAMATPQQRLVLSAQQAAQLPAPTHPAGAAPAAAARAPTTRPAAAPWTRLAAPALAAACCGWPSPAGREGGASGGVAWSARGLGARCAWRHEGGGKPRQGGAAPRSHTSSPQQHGSRIGAKRSSRASRAEAQSTGKPGLEQIKTTIRLYPNIHQFNPPRGRRRRARGSPAARRWRPGGQTRQTRLHRGRRRKDRRNQTRLRGGTQANARELKGKASSTRQKAVGSAPRRSGGREGTGRRRASHASQPRSAGGDSHAAQPGQAALRQPPAPPLTRLHLAAALLGGPRAVHLVQHHQRPVRGV